MFQMGVETMDELKAKRSQQAGTQNQVPNGTRHTHQIIAQRDWYLR